MNDDSRYNLPFEVARFGRADRTDDKPFNRRSLLRKVAAGSLIGVGAGFELAWPSIGAASYTPGPQEKDWGTVRGRIVFPEDAAVPKPREIDLAKYGIQGNDLKWFSSKGPIYSEDWVVNEKSRGVRWVFVWLIPAAGEGKGVLPVHPSLEKPASDTVKIEQPCSGFAPHTVAIREGQKLLVVNDSPVSHAFQYTGSLQSGNQAMPPGSKITIGDLVAHRLPIKVACAPHPWESAWMRVFNHPYFAVTDAEGRYEIKNAPAGTHRMVVWHETAGWLGGASGRNGEKLMIAGGETLNVGDIAIKPRTS